MPAVAEVGGAPEIVGGWFVPGVGAAAGAAVTLIENIGRKLVAEPSFTEITMSAYRLGFAV